MADETTRMTPDPDSPVDEALIALTSVATRQAPEPGFGARLLSRLQDDAAARRAGELGRTGAAADKATTVPRPKLRQRRVLASLGAFAFGAAALLALVPRGTPLPPLVEVSHQLAADRPSLLMAPPGVRVGVAIGPAPGGALYRLELRDRAAVAFRPPGPLHPSQPPLLELREGFVRIVAGAALDIRAADQELRLAPGADVALELVRSLPSLSSAQQQGDHMRSSWLIPTSAAGGAALTFAVLVVQGQVAFTRPAVENRPLPPAGKVLVLHPNEEPATAQRRTVELEQKVAALRTENGQLAGRLARQKGVTRAGVLERIAALRNTPLGGLLSPGAMADLVTDLKGLGAEGVEAMIDLLGSKDAKERFLAANVLEQLNAPAAVGALKQTALTDSDPMTVLGASHALAFMDDPAAVPALRAIADAKPSWGAQVNALWGLCKQGDQKAIAESLAIMKDPKQTMQVRAGLGTNLMVLTDPELLPIVDETLRQFAHHPQGDDEQLGTLAVTYYKNAGTPEARARLATMAEDNKYPESVRKAAREALNASK